MQIVKTYANIGLQGYEITVEADSNKALPTIEIIGLPDATIKEAKERIRGTFRHIGIPMPKNKIVLNLAPSDIKKIGTRFDVPMAVALFLLTKEEKTNKKFCDSALFFGELGLDGTIKKIDGLLPSVLAAIKEGYTTFVIPEANKYELNCIPTITIYGIQHFQEITDFLYGKIALVPVQHEDIPQVYTKDPTAVDFGDIKGHLFAKRAMTIAAAGLHNILLIGTPGSGKTMLTRALRSILPPLTFKEILEISQIYSLVGKLSKHEPLILQRPFRQVHHTASKISIIGGGKNLTPGEISLAHKGVLFFDELPEFPREVLEVLRQPIEDKCVTISRVAGTVAYPANFMFIATMNPCKCGFFQDASKNCSCSYTDIKRYQNKISGPLLDRIDMILEVPRENIDTILKTTETETSATLFQKICTAWDMQQQRFVGTDITTNASISLRDIEVYIPLGTQEKEFLKETTRKLALSPRLIHRIIKIARTIADLEANTRVEIVHLAEALQYRNKTMFVEGM